MNAKVLIALIMIICYSILIVECKKVKKQQKAPVVVQEEDPLIHDYLKLAFWFITGVIVGVYFEAKLSFKNLLSPVLKYGLYGFLGAVFIFIMFEFATFVNEYL